MEEVVTYYNLNVDIEDNRKGLMMVEVQHQLYRREDNVQQGRLDYCGKCLVKYTRMVVTLCRGDKSRGVPDAVHDACRAPDIRREREDVGRQKKVQNFRSEDVAILWNHVKEA